MMIHYAHHWFVNRVAEINLIQQKVEWLLDERLIEKRTVIFTGEHGVGKTWLLLHLWQMFRGEPRLKTYYLDLTQFANQPTVESLRQICQDLSTKLLGETDQSSLAPEEQARLLIQQLRQRLLNQQPLVIFVDSVYESTPALLGTLESYLLAPLAVQPNVLLVMAGRGQPYPWREAELRLRAEFVTLEPFSAEHTREQLQRQLPATLSHAEQTYALSFGNPKANWWLATHQNQARSLSQIVDEMLTPIPSAERSQVRAYLEAVAVPRMFDESMVPLLFYAYTNDTQWQKPSRQSVRQVCDALLRPGLIYWNTDAGGYTLHPATRNLILRYLCAIDRTRWVKLHTNMLNLYESWLRADPANLRLWQEEIAYHQQAIDSQCL